MSEESERQQTKRERIGCVPTFTAGCGSCLLAVSLPVFIFCWRNNEFTMHSKKIFETLFVTHMICGMFIAPGTLILSGLLFAMLERDAAECTFKALLLRGLVIGGILSLTNLPAWLMLLSLSQRYEVFSIFQSVVLYALTASACSTLIANLAWRAVHPNDGKKFQFSLRTLMLVVLAIGLVMAIFHPNPEKTPSFEEILD